MLFPALFIPTSMTFGFIGAKKARELPQLSVKTPNRRKVHALPPIGADDMSHQSGEEEIGSNKGLPHNAVAQRNCRWGKSMTLPNRSPERESGNPAQIPMNINPIGKPQPIMQPVEKKYWFPAKRYGWGWGSPDCWQGWAVIGIWLALELLGAWILLPKLATFAVCVFVLTALFGFTCYLKGEPPKWRWGSK